MPPSTEPRADVRQRAAAAFNSHCDCTVAALPVRCAFLAALVAVASLTAGAAGARAQTASADPTPDSVRITMEALHQLGGVPPGWTLSPPAGDIARGRAAFEQFGCHTCHAVRGETFPAPNTAGPELTGMGAHHPAAYFVESIVNPSAVLVDGPGYIGADGRSAMPAYPDMTVAQLTNLVAYLRSLKSGDTTHLATPSSAAGTVADRDLPAAPPSGERRFLVQAYQIRPGQLAAFEAWFAAEGRAQFLAEPGVIGVDTLVDRTCGAPRVITILTFADVAAFMQFTRSPSADRVGRRFDDFIGLHGHEVYSRPPIYRSEALSARPPGQSTPGR